MMKTLFVFICGLLIFAAQAQALTNVRYHSSSGCYVLVGAPNDTTIGAAITEVTWNACFLLPRTHAGAASGNYTIANNLTIPARIEVIIEKGPQLSIASGKTLTFNGGLRAGPYQIFTGDGSVEFSGNYLIKEYLPEWWGAGVGVAAATNSTAIAAMIAAIPDVTEVEMIPIVKFQRGRYDINDDTVWFSEPMSVHAEGTIFDCGSDTGTCVQIGGATSTAIDPFNWHGPSVVERDYSSSQASTAFAGIGYLVQNVKHFHIYDLTVRGFAQGFYMYADGQGVTTGDVYNYWGVNLQNVRGDGTATAGGFITHVNFFGGSGQMSTTLSDCPSAGTCTNSRNIYLVSSTIPTRIDSVHFYGFNVEGTNWEWRVDIDADYVTLMDMYYDPTTTNNQDIIIQSGSKCATIIGGTLLEAQYITDNGTHSNGCGTVSGGRFAHSSGTLTPYNSGALGANLGELRSGSSGGTITRTYTNDGTGIASTAVALVVRTNDDSENLRELTRITSNTSAVAAADLTGQILLGTSHTGNASVSTDVTIDENGVALGVPLRNYSVAFASLPGSPSNGELVYCNDCTVTSGADNTCAASGSGALAIRVNSVWRCFNAQN